MTENQLLTTNVKFLIAAGFLVLVAVILLALALTVFGFALMLMLSKVTMARAVIGLWLVGI